MRAAFVALSFLLLGCSSATLPTADEAPTPGEADRAKPSREGSDWPKFLGPNGDGSSPETGIPTTWPKEGLRKVWECRLGVGYAPPVVAGGRLYHFDRYGDNARLTCRNAESGELVWKFEYPTSYVDLYNYDPGPRACPVVDGDRIYLHGVEGMLYCVTAADGQEVWKVNTKAKFHVHQNFFGAGSVPIIDGDLLILPVGGSPKGPRPFDLREAKGNGSAIVAFDKKTGEVKYSFSDELASYSSPIIATIEGKRIGLYFARGGLLGFDPQLGKELFYYKWRSRSEESVNAANPVVVGDTILVTECYEKGTACLLVVNGKPTEVWTDAKKDRGELSLMSHWCTPIYHEGHVYCSSGRHTNEADLRCVDWRTGEVKWIERVHTRCTLTKIDGHLLCFGEYGDLRLLRPNPQKYEQLARWEVPGLKFPSWAPPVVSRGLLYLRGSDADNSEGHRLMCYELIPKK